MTGLSNCHCRGLDSVVLSTFDSGRPRARMFVAQEHHELWRNHPGWPMSIAFHSHRAAISLQWLHGPVWNVRGKPGGDLRPFRYESAIVGDHCGFVPTEGPGFSFGDAEQLIGRIDMLASTYHTIFVPKGLTAAWLVYERQLDPDYSPIVYSNADLASFDGSDLYRPMSEAECDRVVRDAAVRAWQ